MGTASGKGIENKEDNSRSLKLQRLSARVDRISIDGLGRTRDDIIVKSVNDLFAANNFEEMLHRSHDVKTKLESLGCFNNVSILIDTSSGPKATPDCGYEVTFKVQEMKRIAGGVQTMIGTNNEGLLVTTVKAPNIFGRGERLQGDFSYGNKQTKNFNFTLSKPLLTKNSASIAGSIFAHDQDWPMSNYKLRETGTVLDFSFFSTRKLKHSLQWEGIIRDLKVGNRYAAFKVREDAGYSMKSAVRHILAFDTRKIASVFPTSGFLAKLTSELAGVGGDVGYVKNDAVLQLNIPLTPDFVLQGTVAGGVMKPLTAENKNVVVCDNFFLGGPVTFRGFETRGASPSIDGSFVGGKMYWSAGLSLFTPLPFRPSVGGFGEYFRTHFFVNTGNVGSFRLESTELWESARLAYGLGLALKLGEIARVEVNYCVPARIREGDRAVHGLQIGIGTSL